MAEKEGNGKSSAPELMFSELHEVRTINNGLEDLRRLGLSIESLIPQERTGVQEQRYVLRRGENEIPLEDLRGLLPAVRAAGEKGLQITRFKGLGEISPKEFKQFIGPDIRIKNVTLDSLSEVNKVLSFYMGKNTPARRQYIMENLVIEI